MNIVFTWIATYERPTDALNAINSGLDAKYNTGNFTQWRQEEKGLSPRAYNFMLQKILSHSEDELTYEQLRAPDPKNPA